MERFKIKEENMDEGGLFFYALWSEEDQEWVGLVHEYPSLSWLAPTEEEALEGIKRLALDQKFKKLRVKWSAELAPDIGAEAFSSSRKE